MDSSLIQSETRIAEPAEIRAAPSHPDPYPYYARLAAQRPLYREGATGPWVVAGAETVQAVLTNPLCFARPADRQVPEAIAGTVVANIYSRLVRLTDGERHCPMKRNITTAVDSVDAARLGAEVRAQADAMADLIQPEQDRGRLAQFIQGLPPRVVAGLVGVPQDHVADVSRWLGDYAATAAAAATGVPALTPELVAAGDAASRQLLALFENFAAAVGSADDSLLARLLLGAQQAGQPDRAAAMTNAIGLLVQNFGATSGLIANALLVLARIDDVRAAVLADRRLIGPLVQETLRCDPVAHGTPRFVAEAGVVAGQAMAKGDMIVVALAAASRDPALNPDPNKFDLLRQSRRHFGFGAGHHACGGVHIATTITEAAVETLLDRGIDLTGLGAQVSYRPSAYIRIPVFGA